MHPYQIDVGEARRSAKDTSPARCIECGGCKEWRGGRYEIIHRPACGDEARARAERIRRLAVLIHQRRAHPDGWRPEGCPGPDGDDASTAAALLDAWEARQATRARRERRRAARRRDREAS